MDPRIKFMGELFYERLEYDDSVATMWKEIETSINQLYDYYETQSKKKQSTSPSQTSFRNRNLLFSGLLSASKKSRTSGILNELHYYIQRVATLEIDPDSGFNNFDILAW